MKISASNIAWKKEDDEEMLAFLKKNGFAGMEIAPTRIFAKHPYEHLQQAGEFADKIKSIYQMDIVSMQSIWFGRQENMFATEGERDILYAYTQKAIDFAFAMRCQNLVFGCPRNRAYRDAADLKTAIPFFHNLGVYAVEHHTVLSMEANPPIYNTNYCNTTGEAMEQIRRVDSKGFLLNLDVGTMIQNHEDIGILEKNPEMIHHVHISEPFLNPIEHRELHKELSAFLKESGYEGFVSLEVKMQDDLELVKDMLLYVQETFA